MEKQNCIPPSLDSMLSYKWWEIHEAAFVMTSWPKNLMPIDTLLLIYEQLNRKFLFVPTARLQKKAMNSETRKLLTALETAIENGELSALQRNLRLCPQYGRNVSYLVLARDTIAWTISKGYILPQELQDRLQLNQIDPEPRKYADDIVKNKIIGQFYLSVNPKMNILELCRDEKEWFSQFGIAKPDKTLRKWLNELFDKPGEPGRQLPLNLREGRPYSPTPILEVMEKDPNGTACYHFPMLKIAIKTATKIIMDQIGRESLFKMTVEAFSLEVFSNKVVNLYLACASKSIRKLCKSFIITELARQFFYPKIKKIPLERRQVMTIEQLNQHSQLLFLESLTMDFGQ